MKIALGDTHYEVLQVAPTATAFEIRQAYAEACALYGEDALATYTMFDEAQRRQLLATLAEAYETLIDADRRRAYDERLREEGRLPEARGAAKVKEAPSAATSAEITLSAGTDSVKKRVLNAADSPDFRKKRDAVLAQDLITGSDLRCIREMLGITCEEIYDATRISVSIITAIESDDAPNLPSTLYLKNFIKTYAALLEMDPQQTMTGYLKNIGIA
jgi:curved DNA-binding protein CbpA